MSYLVLDSLRKIYDDQSIGVQSVSLTVEKGEFVTFLGPSGSGKTTTLSMVAGFVPPTAGRVIVAGQDITHTPPRKRNFGMVFQDYSLFPHMTVEENIAFPLEMRGEGKESCRRKVMDALALVGLERFAKRFSGQLSGGQQQRVAIARAIVYEPSVLLMDEPLGALDRLLRDRMQLEIKHIQQELGITTLYVTHDQTEALTMSDRICVFNNGEIVQAGSPDQIYEQPESRFVAEFIGETNLITGVCRGVEQRDGLYCHTVDLGGQRCMAVASKRRMESASKVSVSIRPEYIALCGDETDRQGAQAAGKAVFEGTITDSIYQGSTQTLEIDAGIRPRLMARVAAGRKVRNGEPVAIALDNTKAVLLPFSAAD